MYILFLLPNLLFAQDKHAIRLSPFYPGIIGNSFENFTPFFGSTIGYDFILSDKEVIGVDIKPRLHILDGEGSAYELRVNPHYKRFIKNNFFLLAGVGISYYHFEENYYSIIETNIYSFNPNLLIGRRNYFSKNFFLDVGMGLNAYISFYGVSKQKHPLDIDIPEPWEYNQITIKNLKYGHKFSYLGVFQLGYKF